MPTVQPPSGEHPLIGPRKHHAPGHDHAWMSATTARGVALLFALLPLAHPALRPLVGVPSHLLWFSHVLPVAVLTYRAGRRGAVLAVGASAVAIFIGERAFGGGYGVPADWETTIALTSALTFTNLLVAGFALFAHHGEASLQHQAMHDGLTGLPNRVYLHQLITMAVARARRTRGRYRFAVLFIDVDQFKRVNDSLGHVAGDAFLRQFAARLTATMRTVDAVARLGGDEFAVLLDDLAEHYDAARAAERIREALRDPFDVSRQQLVITASIGIANGDPSYDSADQMLRDADTAMYRAKAAGRGRAEAFDAQMHVDAVRSLELESELRAAVTRGELSVVYQPLVDLQSDALAGFEALVRWRSGTRGIISPADFIPLAEERGLIEEIGAWVLDEVGRTLCGWRQRGLLPAGVYVNVNVSPRQLQSERLIELVSHTLREYAVPNGSLGLEITETAMMQDPGTSAERLRMLRHLGVRIAVDDFGTGYSSLGYLQRFPIDAVKIDRSFVSGMASGSANMEIVRAVTALGRELRLKVVAEGIETEQQLQALRTLGCHIGQGYLLSRPLSRFRATAQLARLRPAPRRLRLA